MACRPSWCCSWRLGLGWVGAARPDYVGLKLNREPPAGKSGSRVPRAAGRGSRRYEGSGVHQRGACAALMAAGSLLGRQREGNVANIQENLGNRGCVRHAVKNSKCAQN